MRSTLATETGNEARRSAAKEDQRKTKTRTKDEGNDFRTNKKGLPFPPPSKTRITKETKVRCAVSRRGADERVLYSSPTGG